MSAHKPEHRLPRGRLAAALLLACACGAPEAKVASAPGAAPRSRASVQGGTVAPLVECVVDHRNGSFTSYFGWTNTGGAALLPIGAGNQFTPKPADRGQPTSFAQGASGDFPAFAARVDAALPLTWSLPGGDAVATSGSPRCPDTAAPSWPSGSRVTLSLDTGSSITLGWTAARDDAAVALYRIYQGGTLVLEVDGAVTTALVSGLSAAHDYAFKVEAVDAAGNASSDGPSVYRDTHPPVITVSGVANGQVSRADSLLPTFSARDDLIGAVSASLDGLPFASGDPVSAEGAHVLVVTARDLAGHSATSTTRFALDRTPPVLTLRGPADGSYLNRAATLTFTVQDASAVVVTALLDGSPFVSGASVRTAGPHLAQVTAVDAAGNTASATLSFTVDLTAPSLSLIGPAANAVLASPLVTVVAAVADASPLALVAVNGTALALQPDGTWSAQLTLPEGPTLLSLVATDVAGNAAHASLAVAVDTTPPAITVSSPLANAKIAALATTVLGAVRDATSVQVSVNGTAATVFRDGSFSARVALTPGANDLLVHAVDAAGNASDQHLAVRANIVPPTVAIAAPPAGMATNATPLLVRVNAAPADGTDAVTVTIQGQPATRDTDGSFFLSVPLASGSNTLRAVATDGYHLSSSAQVAVALDTTAPAINTGGVIDGEISRVAAVAPTFSATDAHLASVSATLDALPFLSGAPVSSEGPHTLVVTALDTAGNQATRTVQFTLDRTPPTLAITGVRDLDVFAAAPAIAFTAADDHLDPRSPTATLDGLVFLAGGAVSEGRHTLVVTARDLAGNRTAATVHFTLDLTPPTVAVSAPRDGSVTRVQPAPVSALVRDPLSGVARVSANGVALVASGSIWTGAVALQEGPNTVAVVATDNAGNSATQQVTVTLDTRPPVLDVTSPVDGTRFASLFAHVIGTASDSSPVTVKINTTQVALAADGSFAADVPVPQGASTLQIVATDAAGNATTVRRAIRANATPPTIAITAPAQGTVTAATSITVRGTVAAGDRTDLQPLAVAVSGVAAVVSKGAFSAVVPLAPGDNTLHAVVTDGYALTGSADVLVAQDSAPPAISISGVSDGQYSNQPAVVPVFSASDDHLAAVTATLDGAPFASGTPVSTEGAHTLVVSAADAVGNRSTASARFVLDRTPPAISVSGALDGQLFTGPVTLRFSVTDANPGTSSATLDGQPFASGGTVSAEGAHALLVTATDLAGNGATSSVAFRIDATPPTLTILAPSPGSYQNAQPVTVIARVDDGGSGAASVAANGVALLPSGASGVYSGAVPLSEGGNTISVLAFDKAGNRAQQTLSVILDTRPPSLSVDAPAEGDRVASLALEVSGAAHDPSPLRVLVNGAPVATASDGTFTTTIAVPQGASTVTVAAIDAAGNVTTVQRTVRANGTPPALAVSAPADGLVTSATSVNVQGTALAADAADTAPLTVTVNGAAAALQPDGSFSVPVALVAGANLIHVVATDGYLLSTAVDRAVLQDSQPPVVTITGVSDGQFSNLAALVPAFAATDAHLASVAATLDGAPFASGTPVSSEGPHTLVVTAADTAGNQTTRTVRFALDRTPPDLQVTGAHDGDVFAAPVALSFTATDANLASSAATLDGAPFTSGATVSAEGPHTLVVTASDLAGNGASVTVKLRIDATPPALLVLAPLDGQTLGAQPAAILVQASDDGSGLRSVTANGQPLASTQPGLFAGLVPLLEGANSILVVATDNAGNSASQGISVLLDTTPPQLVVNAPVDGARSSQLSFQVTGTVRDASQLVLRVNGAVVSPAQDGTFSALVEVPQGQSQVLVEAVDAAANRSAVSRTVRANATPPSLTVVSPVPGAPLYTSAASLTLQGTAAAADATDDAPLAVAVNSVQATLAADGTWSAEVPLAAGHNALHVVATDGYGLTSAVDLAVEQSATPPAIAISGVQDGQVSAGAQLVPSFTATSLLPVTVTATLDGAPFSSGTPVAAEGDHALVVTAVDAASNTATAEVAFALDRTAPALQVAGVTDGERRNSPALIVFSATDAHPDTVSATVDGVPFSSGATVTGEGAHRLIVTAIDKAGNRAGDSRGFTIDSTPPLVTLSAPRAGLVTRQASLVVVASVAEEGPLAQVTLSGQAMTQAPDGTWQGPAALVEGDNFVEVVAVDAAGNTGRGSVHVRLDTAPPSLNVSAPAEGARIAALATAVGGSVSDASNVTVAVNGAPAIVGTGGSFSAEAPLVQGANTLIATATDEAGNSAQVQVHVRANATAPSLAVSAPAPGSTTSEAQVTFAGHAAPADPLDSVALTVAGQPVSVGSDGSFSTSVALVEGANFIALSAVDGYLLHTDVSVSVTRTSTAQDAGTPDAGGGGPPAAPTISLDAPAAGAVLSAASIAVSGSITGGTPPLAVTVDGSAVALVGSAFSTSIAPAEGDHTITATVTDGDGRTATAERVIHVDRTPPLLTITSPASTPTLADFTPYTVQGTVSDQNLDAVLVQGSQVTVAGGSFSAQVPLQLGDNDVTVLARDLAGNQTTSVVRLTVGRLAPTVTVVTPTAGAEASADNIHVQVSVQSGSRLASVQIGTGPAASEGGQLWGAQVALTLGHNFIPISATDVFGLTGTATVDVHYKDPATEPLVVQNIDPAPGTQSVVPDTIVSLTFNKAFDQTSLAGHFVVSINGQPVDGGYSVSPSAQTVSFVPRQPLPEGARVTVLISGIAPQAGPGLSSDWNSDFTVRPALTIVRGAVVDEQHLGIANVPVALEEQGLSARTALDGTFVLFGKSGGQGTLVIGGSNNDQGQALPTVRRTLFINAGATTTAPVTVLVPTSAASAVFVDSSSAVSATFNGVYPGLQLDLGASGIVFPDGRTSGFLTATRVPNFAGPPTQTKRRPSALYQLTPQGARLSAPVTISLPNTTGHAAGRRMLAFSYDPGKNTLIPAGYARVTDDGKSVRTEGALNATSLEYFGYTSLTDGEQTATNSAPARRVPAHAVPPAGGKGVWLDGDRLLRSPEKALQTLLGVRDAQAYDALGFWIPDFNFLPTWVSGRLRTPHEVHVTLEVPAPQAMDGTVVTLGPAGQLCPGVVADPDALSKCPAGLQVVFGGVWGDPAHPAAVVATLAATVNNTPVPPPYTEVWVSEVGTNQATIPNAHVPLAYGVTQLSLNVTALAEVSSSSANKTFTAELKLPPAADNQPANVYYLTVKEVPSKVGDDVLDTAGLFSLTPVWIGGEESAAITDANGHYFYFPIFYWTAEEDVINFAEFDLPRRPIQDRPGHIVMIPGVYYARSFTYGLTDFGTSGIDIMVDARVLSGALHFKDKTGKPLKICNDGTDTKYAASDNGEVETFSASDIAQSEVYFFREDDLSAPIADFALAASPVAGGSCDSAGQAVYSRLRIGPSDYNSRRQQQKCEAANAAGDKTSDFYKSWCSPGAIRKHFLQLQAHDRLIIAAVNHATGYSGIARVEVPPINSANAGSCGSALPRPVFFNGGIKFIPACAAASLEINTQIDMYPPELDVRVARRSLDEGVAADPKDHLIRTGGAATTNDQMVKIQTHWRVRRAPVSGPPPGPNTDGGTSDCGDYDPMDGGSIVHGAKADGGYCDVARIADRGFDGGTGPTDGGPGIPLEIYCSQVPLGGDLTQCLTDDSTLTDMPKGVPPLAGRIWTQTGSAGGEPLPVYFDVTPGSVTANVNPAVPIMNANHQLVTFGNLAKAHYYVQVVGKPLAPQATPPPDWTDGPKVGLPKAAVGLKTVYKGLNADGSFQLRYDKSREHQFSVLKIDDHSITAQGGSGDTRNLLDGGYPPAAEEQDQSYAFLMNLVEPTDLQRAPPPGDYELRLGGDVAGMTCQLQIQDSGGGKKSLSGTCGGDSLMDVISAADVLYLELYLSGNAENVLYRFNFNGLSLRQDQLAVGSQDTKAKAAQPELDGTKTPRRAVMQPSLAQFFVQPSELKKGIVKLCLNDETCGDSANILKTLQFDWNGTSYVLTDQNTGRADTKSIPVAKRGFGVQDATFYTVPLPNDILGRNFRVFVRYEPQLPQIKPFSRGLGSPVNIWQNRAASPPGHEMVADVDVADGHLALRYEDLKVPEGGSTVRFERIFNNQDNDATPLGIGWTHSYDAFVLEEAAGRYTAVVAGQSYEFPSCTVKRLGGNDLPTEVKDCLTNKAHGGTLEVTITTLPDGRQGYNFKFTHQGDRFVWFFSQPAQHDDRDKREEGGRKWLATTITEGLGLVTIKYLPDSDLIDTVERDVGKVRLKFEYQDIDKMFDGTTDFTGKVGERLKRLAATEGFKLLKQVSVQLKGGATIDSVQFEHDEDLVQHLATAPVRAGNLTGVRRATETPNWYWLYTYPDLAGASDNAWLLRNELQKAQLKVGAPGAEVLQKEWTYGRSTTVAPYEHLDPREVVDSVIAPGHQGQAITFDFHGQNSTDRDVSLPGESGARKLTFKLNPFGSVLSMATPLGLARTAQWGSTSDVGLVRPSTMTTPAGLSYGFEFDGSPKDALAVTKRTLNSGPSDAIDTPGLTDGTELESFKADPNWIEPTNIATAAAGGKRNFTREFDDTGQLKSTSVEQGGKTFLLYSETHGPDGACLSGINTSGASYVCGAPDALGLPTTYTVSAPGGAGGGLSTAVIETHFDSLGRAISRSNSGLGSADTWQYDGLGRITQHTSVGQPTQVWTTTYDDGTPLQLTIRESLNGTLMKTSSYQDGLMVSRAMAWGSGALANETRTYSGGVLTSSSQETGGGASISKSFTYDADGRLTDVTTDGTVEMHLVLNADGYPKSRTDMNGLVTGITYDKLNRPVQWDYGNGDVVKVERDPTSGEIIAETQGAHRINLTRDAVNRVTSRASAANPGSYSVTYGGDDAAGSVTLMNDDGLAETWAYGDALGRVTQHTRTLSSGATLVESWQYQPTGSGNQVTLTQTRSPGTPGSRTVVSTFDPLGRLLSADETVDGQGSGTAYVYDDRGNVIHLTRAQGSDRAQKTDYVFDLASHLTQVTLPTGEVANMTVDALGRTTDITGPRAGLHWTIAYDSFMRETSRTLAAIGTHPGGTWTTDWTAHDGSVTTTDAVGVQTKKIFNPRDLLLSEVKSGSGGSRSTTYEYDGSWVKHEVKSEGAWRRELTSAFDDRGRRTSQQESWSGSGGGYSYSTTTDWGSPLAPVRTETWPGGSRVSTLTLDGLGSTLAVELGGVTNSATYDALGTIVSRTAPGLSPVNFTYEESGRIKSAQQGSETTQYSYFADGLVKSIVDPSGRTSSSEYDLSGRATARSFGASGEVWSQTMAYGDGGDRPTSVTDSDGRAMNFTYGPNGELLTASVPDVGAFTYSYFGDGQLKQVDSPDHASWQTFDYDFLRRETKRTRGSLTWQTSWTDGAATRTDPAANGMTTVFDGRGRPASVTYAPGASSVPGLASLQYSFTDLDQPAHVVEQRSDGTVAVDYGFDSRGRVSSIGRTEPSGNTNVTYTYKDFDAVESETSNGGTTSYGYDAFGRPSSISNDSGRTTQVTWEPGGGRVTLLDDGAFAEARCYTGQGWTRTVVSGRLADSSCNASGATVRSDYAYDPRGNPLTETRSDFGAAGEVTRYGYDQADRMTGVRYADGRAVFYGLTPTGSRSSEVEVSGYSAGGSLGPSAAPGGNVVRSLTYRLDAAERIIGVIDNVGGQPAITIEQDDAGRIRRYDADGIQRQLGWDAAGRLVSATVTRPDTSTNAPPGATISTHVASSYDHQNWRTRVDSESQHKTFIWGKDALVEETDDHASPRLYERAGDTVSAIGADRIAHDARDSAVARVSDGSVVATTRFDSYGTPLAGAPGAADPTLGYAGQSWDPDLSLSYAQQRWYAPKLGRFLSEDPLGMTPDRMMGLTDLNGFAYAGNNPNRNKDPNGELATEVGAVAGFFWGATQMFYSMGKDLYNGTYHSTGDYLSIGAQNIIAGTELGLSVDVGLLSGGWAAAGSGALGFAGFDALTFNGEPKKWKDFGIGQLKEGAKGAIFSLALLKVGAPAVKFLAETSGGKWVIQKGAGFATGAFAKLAGNPTIKAAAELAGKTVEDFAEPILKSQIAGDVAKLAARDNFIGRAAARQAEELAAKTACAGGVCSGLNCFVAGTLVATAGGEKPIEQVAIGDQVLSRDETTGEVSYKPVVGTMVTPDRALVDISVERQDGKRDTLRTTLGHPFWVQEQGWTWARDLKAGDALSTPQGGWLRVTANTWVQETATVYNFEVESTHTYFVGETQTWVHNACPSSLPPGEGPAVGEQVAGNGREYLGPHYDEAVRLHGLDPEFFPNPATTTFRKVTGEELRAARAEFDAAGVGGHHVHPLNHGGEAVPTGSGLAYTGESTIRASKLAGEDLTFYGEEYGKQNAKVLKIHQPNPDGPMIFGPNPRHTRASTFWEKVKRWQGSPEGN